MTRVVLAPDSFKGSMTAARAAAAIADGWRSVEPDAQLVARPMADGGEGTLDAFEAAAADARRVAVTVVGPHGRPVAASWLHLPGPGGGTGVVELGSTSGIELLDDTRRPWDAGTTGFGQAIAAALDHGVDRLVLGIGSSASTDGGAGMLAALGARVRDENGAEIATGLRGLAQVASVDLSLLRPLPPGGVVVLSDVASPLLGTRGAAVVFGPQKGLDTAGVAAADQALTTWARLLSPVAPTEPDPLARGAGAAGGTGFGLLAWGARLVPGASEVAALVGLDLALADADIVITGEGSYDGQSAAGKAPAFVAERARPGTAAVLVAGRIEGDADVSSFDTSISLTDLAGSASASLADPYRWLRAAGAELATSMTDRRRVGSAHPDRPDLLRMQEDP